MLSKIMNWFWMEPILIGIGVVAWFAVIVAISWLTALALTRW